MLRTIRPLAFALLPLFLLACGQAQETPVAGALAESASSPIDTHNSRNSLDWGGRYTGELPDPTCGHKRTVITLGMELDYSRIVQCQNDASPAVFDQGVFQWDVSGGRITLVAGDGSQQTYQVGENVLFLLDPNGNRMTGDQATQYQLVKAISNPDLENHKWVLFELRGDPVTDLPGNQQAYFTLNSSEARVTGNTSCNNFFASYELKQGGRVTFSDMGATMMACPEMTTESAFLGVLEKTDNYAIGDGILSLNKARMAPLARFRLGTQPAKAE